VMTPQEREKTAADIAGILARGYDLHIRDHGPDGSHAIRTEAGDRYEVVQTADGAVSFIERGGERFAVNVIPLADQDEKGPLFTYAEGGQP
jgi:hypothetical protein